MTPLPNLTDYDGFLFDLDGVITPTERIHKVAWQRMFDELFDAWGVEPPYTDADYYRFVDGKNRYQAVADVMRSRDVEVPWGDPTDDPTADTVCGVGNRKNSYFSDALNRDGVQPFPGSLALLDRLREYPLGIVSSSQNARIVLAAAGVADRFRVVVDGVTAREEHLSPKPAGDTFAYAARLLGIEPDRVVAFEDAISGVASARAAGMAVVVGVNRGAGEQALLDNGADVVVTDLQEFVG